MTNSVRVMTTQWMWAMAAIAMFSGCAGCRVESDSKPGAGGAGAVEKSTGGSATASTGDVPTGPKDEQAKQISVDGSSTVYPISQAVAQVYNEAHPDVQISVGLAGTGGGFKRFALGDLDICDASRPIRDSEIETCKKAGIEYLELQVAVDALTVVVNPANDWAKCLTVAQLKKLWEPESKITKWNELDPSWPDHKIELFGADTDSGTFDYFTEVIVGKAKSSRADYTSNANDNYLVQGVADEKFALGYFGYGYYVENLDRLKGVSIKATDESDCVVPSPETVDNGTYVPLSRPLFIYVNQKSLKRKEVAEYLQFYLSDAGQKMVTERKFLLMKQDVLASMRERLTEALK